MGFTAFKYQTRAHGTAVSAFAYRNDSYANSYEETHPWSVLSTYGYQGSNRLSDSEIEADLPPGYEWHSLVHVPDDFFEAINSCISDKLGL